ATFSDQGGGSVVTLSLSPQVLHARNRGPDHIEVFGSVREDALYIDYNAGALTASSGTFRLPCPAGGEWAKLDAIAHPAGYGGDALVLGRSLCNGQGMTSTVARVANIATAPSIVWSADTETGSGCDLHFSPCMPAVLAYDDTHPEYALTVTPLGRLAPVRVA